MISDISHYKTLLCMASLGNKREESVAMLAAELEDTEREKFDRLLTSY